MAGLIPSGGEAEESENPDINVTPFIDVMLVLLIIFMIAAPLATVDVPVDLPMAKARMSQRPEQPVWLTLTVDLRLRIGDDLIAVENLATGLDRATGGDHETRLYVRADRGVAYGEVMALLNRLRGAGYLKIALVGLDAG